CALHPFTGEMESMMFFSEYERRFNDMLDYYKHYFAAMDALGAKIFVLHGGKSAGNISLYTDRFNRLSETAASFGVTVAQENVARFASRSLPFLENLKNQLGDNAAFVLDVKQAVRSGENPLNMLKTLGSSVKHVHISDHGQYGDCMLLGSGNFQVKNFLQTLAKLSPDCSVMLELYRNAFGCTADLVQNYQVLSRMAQSLE
ncbi:MAG: sugar phosphate isomerase/epimerase, partial [Oscillospiraceae bacterium]|nr:sugar phosphate isomerase/epimerase [Oscillospiraceae bacterium]